MPSRSKAQHNLMAGVAHGWKPDQVKAPPVGVAKEFVVADKGTGQFGKPPSKPGIGPKAPGKFPTKK